MLTRSAIIAVARTWKGTPYHHQASLKGVGTDCLGLVRGIYRELYACDPESPPPYTPDWAEAGGRETLLEAARRHLVETPRDAVGPGDVLVFRWRAGSAAKHVGIYIAPQRMIHAIEGLPVTEIRLSPWWWRHCVGIFAFPGVEPVTPPPQPY
jgi:NlpC/P60 family putative phage cell wall peptidase